MSISEKEYQDFASQYKCAEEEILVLLSDANGGAGRGKEAIWSASAYFLAYQDTQTGAIIKGDGRLVWPISDADLKAHSSSYPYFFERGGIYRLRVRDLLDRTVPTGGAPSFYNRFLVVDILEIDVESDALNEILEVYRKPVVLKDEILGEFILNRDYSNFDGSIIWMGKEISVYMDVDKEDEASWTKALNYLHFLYEKQKEMDKEFRCFAAEKLTELANDWLQDEEDAEITKDDFIRRMELSELSISMDGDYSAYYFDDDMFLGHSITVSGNVESGIKDANIEG